MKTISASFRVLRAALCGTTLLVGSLLATRALVAADKPAKSADAPGAGLIGTWVHVGAPGKTGEPPAKGGFIKLRTERHWAAINIDARTGLVTSTHGGTWKISGNQYQETTEFGGEYQSFIMGKTFTWKVTLEGDTMTMLGVDNGWHEVWRRLK